MIGKLIRTFKDDMWTLGMAYKIAFYSVENNPIYLAEMDSIERERDKERKIEEKKRQLEESYSKELADDGSDEEEISEHIRISQDMLRNKACVLSFEFWPCEHNEMTETEKDVDRAMCNIRDPFLNLRFIIYVFSAVFGISWLISLFC